MISMKQVIFNAHNAKALFLVFLQPYKLNAGGIVNYVNSFEKDP